jgi:hypothetical protein
MNPMTENTQVIKGLCHAWIPMHNHHMLIVACLKSHGMPKRENCSMLEAQHAESLKQSRLINKKNFTENANEN